MPDRHQFPVKFHFKEKLRLQRLKNEDLSFRPNVSQCLCKNFFEANIICTKNLFDFSTKVQKCLWSCQMTLITSSKLTSLHWTPALRRNIILSHSSLQAFLSADFCLFWEPLAWCSGIIIWCLPVFEMNKSLAEAIDVTDKQYFCHPGIGDGRQSSWWW